MKYITRYASILTFLAALNINHALASNWQLDVTPNDLAPGKNVYVALTVTQLNSEFSVICDHRGLAVEILIEGILDYDVAAMDIGFGVDGDNLIRMRGYPEVIDDGLATALLFYDRRGLPNIKTPEVIKQLKRGNTLFIIDPSNDGIIEEVSLKGSSKAITSVEKACETGIAGTLSDERLDDLPSDSRSKSGQKI